MGVITIAVANSNLDLDVYPEWDLLDDSFKQHYIDRASVYVQLKWEPPATDTDFDWNTPATWDNQAELEALVAKYSDAVRAGIIYPSEAQLAAPKAPIKKTTEKVGSLEVTTEYAQSTAAQQNATTGALDDEMTLLGFTRKVRSNTLVRV